MRFVYFVIRVKGDEVTYRTATLKLKSTSVDLLRIHCALPSCGATPEDGCLVSSSSVSGKKCSLIRKLKIHALSQEKNVYNP